jgi:protein-tyrosine-phosphatase
VCRGREGGKRGSEGRLRLPSNEGRSQFAAALLDHHAKGRVDVPATGAGPTGRLNPVEVLSLAELGVALSEPYPSRRPMRSSAWPAS